MEQAMSFGVDGFFGIGAGAKKALGIPATFRKKMRGSFPEVQNHRDLGTVFLVADGNKLK